MSFEIANLKRLMGARFFGVGGRVDGRLGLAITRALLGDFFDIYLKGLPGRANQLRAEYPELTAETR